MKRFVLLLFCIVLLVGGFQGDLFGFRNLSTTVPQPLETTDVPTFVDVKRTVEDFTYAHLDGNSQYFYRNDTDFPESGITGATDLTLQFWIRPDTVSTNTTVASKWHATSDKRMYLLLKLSDEFRFVVSSDGTEPSTAGTSVGMDLVAEEWVFVAVVYDASEGTADFYKNGIFISQVTSLEESIADKDPDFKVGTYNDNANLWDGGVGPLALFNDKRTAAEILASSIDYDEDLSAAGNIIATWLFTEAGAATAIDNAQTDAGRDLTPYDGGDVAYSACGRTPFLDISAESNLTATAPATLTGDDIGITVAKDLVTTAPITGATDNIFPGADADITVALTLLKDLVTTAPITGGTDDILPGSDADVTVAITVLKDIVAGTGLSGGENDVLPGADADTTINIDTTWAGTLGSLTLGGNITLDSVTTTLSAAQVNGSRAAPVTVVAAQGSNTWIELVSAVITYDYDTAAFTVGADEDLVIEYADGTDATASIETTGFLDQGDDELRFYPNVLAAGADIEATVNQALRIFNAGSGETADGGSSEVDVRVTYRVYATGL